VPRLGRRVLRWAILVHLYLGVAMCALFVMWFATGIVLMYAPFPGFRQDPQFERLSVLDCTNCSVPLAAALPAMIPRDTTATVRVGMLLGRPVYRFLGTDRRWHVLYADNGSLPGDVTAAQARRIAAAHAGLSEGEVRQTTVITAPDQWTVEAVFRRQLPLYRVDFADPSFTSVYVSTGAGEALLVSTRRERTLAWVGAIPHWLYPRVLRARVSAWVWTVIVVSALGVVMSVAGLVIGVWQFRFWRRRSRAGRVLPRSPYRTAWMRWHHYFGLLFGVFTFTWMLSGLLSVDPLDWSPGSEATPAERLVLAGGALDGAAFRVDPRKAVELVSSDIAPREMQAVTVSGRPYWVAYQDASRSRLVAADGSEPVLLTSLDAGTLLAGSPALVPGARIEATEELGEYDDYYYAASGRSPALPIYRVRFDDGARSAFYLDPRTGSIAMKQVTRSRMERWLYTGLHDLDFQALYQRRPLWDLVVILLSLGGLALSVTGVVAAWRWVAQQAGLPAGPRR
jgi:hypothetical protein